MNYHSHKQDLLRKLDKSNEDALYHGLNVLERKDLSKPDKIQALADNNPDWADELNKLHNKALKDQDQETPDYSIPTGADSNKDIAYDFADYLATHHDIIPVQQDPESNVVELWKYHEQEKIWRKDGEGEIQQIGRKHLKEDWTRRMKKEVINQLKSMERIPQEKTGPDTGQLPVQNKIMDIPANRARDINRKDYITGKLPVQYDSSAECPKFLEYLENSVPDKDHRAKLQEFTGYALMPWTCKHKRAMMLLGPTNSGKSVYLEILNQLLGEDNTQSIALQQLGEDKYTLPELQHAWANIRHDLDPRQVTDTGIFKELVSGDQIQVRPPYGKPFKMKSTAKHIFSANQMPDAQQEDTAYLDRWLITPFPNTIPEDQRRPEYKDKPKETFNLPGILNWALQGMKRLEQQEGFTGDLHHTKTKVLMQEWGNSVERFIAEHLDLEHQADTENQEDLDYRLHTETAYKLYEQHAVKNNDEVKSKNKFSRELGKLPGVRKGQPTIRNQRRRGFFGVQLSDNAAKEIKE